MSGHLCLKWNNHSSAFLKSITKIQSKERFCDATIVCQGKYFPVHRVVLSTCSDYFDEIFERIQCPHPYIVFKDIDPKEMELLLNYMYQGEVNVTQESLPSLIKAAEALRIKGLAVPDDIPANRDGSHEKKRCSVGSSSDGSHSKRKVEENKRKRMESSELHSQNTDNNVFSSMPDGGQARIIKEEPLDPSNYEEEVPPSEPTLVSPSNESHLMSKDDDFIMNFVRTDNSNLAVKTEETLLTMKTEDTMPVDDSFEKQFSDWTDFGSSGDMSALPPSDLNPQDDINCQDSQSVMASQSQSPFSGKSRQSAQPRSADSRRKSMFQCPRCPYRSARKHHVKRHLMLKHNRLRPFLCAFCPKRFGSGTDVRRHTLIHTGEKPYQCSRCHISFRYCTGLNLHKLNNPECSAFT